MLDRDTQRVTRHPRPLTRVSTAKSGSRRPPPLLFVVPHRSPVDAEEMFGRRSGRQSPVRSSVDDNVCTKFPTTPRRVIDKFLQEPASSRIAAFAIISTTIIVAVAGAVLMRLVDNKEYPNLGRALRFTLQTVTIAGYRDDT